MGKNKNTELSVEEQEIRTKEDALFEKLKAPPSVLGGVMDVLNDKSKSDAVAKQRVQDKKRRIEREDKRMKSLKNAFNGIEEPAKRRRTRRK